MTDPSARGALRAWRDGAGLSQRELADRLGLKQPAIAQWEAGGRPDLAKALELQSLTEGHVLAVSWGYTDEQVERVLRAAKFPAPCDDSGEVSVTDDVAEDDEPSGPVVITEGYSQVAGG